ncbi:hypothetical protein [Roseisolibacter sp. H3M3-2]|uniref:hypothetical protein n=1 Tax=Roseisolibacter sp. H3M3-2 TaxID=3031323 RepID=UPI0023DC0601|nr:hypothetical protein [Roseisolibacter sp. H3M3-2]MDF1504901.1 hypothetical protein [Roseisolibacter sp. H3M3-2]
MRGPLALEAAALVRNASTRRLGEETRCGGFFGCVTGTYVQDYRYEQTMAVLGRAAWRLATGRRLTPVLTLGAGPARSRVETMDGGVARRSDVLAEGALAVEFGRVSRLTAEAAARGPVSRGATVRGPELALRLGRAFGYR